MRCWVILYLVGCFLGHNLKLCWTRRKRLYVPPEINQRRLQMKKCFFRKNWGWDTKLEVKGYVLVVKVQFLQQKVWKIEDRCTSILPQADRPELPYEVDFWRNRFEETFRTNRFSEKFTFFGFLGGWVWVFPKRFWWDCKDFGLEPWRKMMLGGQLSHPSNQIN